MKEIKHLFSTEAIFLLNWQSPRSIVLCFQAYSVVPTFPHQVLLFRVSQHLIYMVFIAGEACSKHSAGIQNTRGMKRSIKDQ
jgi:hypothetical protein